MLSMIASNNIIKTKPLSFTKQKKRASKLLKSLKSLASFKSIKLILVVLFWYSCSSLTNNIGKQILTQFRYPLTLTFVQFGFISIFTWMYVAIIRRNEKNHFVPLSKSVFWNVFPLVIFNIFGHSLSSIAISKASVSFVHTIKALSPFFTVFFSKLLLGSTFSKQIYISLIPLISGVILACSTEITFNLIGLLSALASALIFVVQNIFSKKLFQDGKLDELNLVFYSSLFAFIAMIPLWLYEDFIVIYSESQNYDWSTYGLFLLNGLTHFGQNILAFTLMTLVTPVSYSIASLLKRIFIIITSIIWFSTPITLSNTIGMILTFTGLWLYTRAKTHKKKDPILPLDTVNNQSSKNSFTDLLPSESELFTFPKSQ